MCLFRRKKKEVDELAEYENNTYNCNDEYVVYGERNKDDACFITQGDIFVVRNVVIVLGVALKEITIGDKVKIGNKVYKIKGIEMYRKMVTSLKPGDNGALAFDADKSLSPYILDMIKKDSVYNEPFNFDGKPTTLYTYFYKN